MDGGSRPGRSGAVRDASRTDESRVGAVLLAAGLGTRFESGNKLLATLGGVPIVRRAAETLLVSSVTDVVAVLGHEATAVGEALDGLELTVRINDNYREGQSTSVATGVGAARDRGWDAAIFALGDMPAVDPATVDALLSAYAEGAGSVLAPSHGGSRGNPVLFDDEYFDALADVSGDRGGREIIESSGRLLPVDDPGIHQDVDRDRDLEHHR